MSEVAHIPQLRFPEFSGAWEEKKLGEVVRYTKGFAFKSNDYVDSGVRIIRVSDLGAESIKKDNKSIYLSSVNEHLYDKWKIRKNNIVITTVGSNPDLIESAVGRGIFIINDNEGLLNQNMLKLENSSQLNNKFVHCFINSPKYIHHIKAIKRGNANQANITVKELLDFKLSITTKPEQQKIAAFLTAVDTKIELLRQKQELLGEYKKGVMQQIFSQTIRFRADDGSEFPDWEEKKLGSVSIRGASNISANQLDDNNGDYKIYGAAGHLKNIDFYTEDEPYIAIVKDGAGVGRTMLLESKTSVLGTLAIIKVKQGNDINFLYWLVQTINFNKYVVGSTIPHIYYRDYQTEKLKIPSLVEQTKIANFLSSIDSKIEQVGKQLDESKQFKKALLQQMFV